MMKEYQLNSMRKIDKVIIVAKYKDKWVLCNNGMDENSCLQGNVISGNDIIDTAKEVLRQFGVIEHIIMPLWDFTNEEGSYRVLYSEIYTLESSSGLIFMETIPNDFTFIDLVLKTEVMVTANRLLDYIDSLNDVSSCVVHGRKLIGSVSEVSSFELILNVSNARSFAFKLPDLLSNHFFTSLQAYRVFPDKFVLNINFSKLNPLFVVRFSIKK